MLDAPTIQGAYINLLRPSGKHPKGFSPKIIKNVHRVLHKALQQAVLIGYIRFNPADTCILPRVEKAKVTPCDDAQISPFIKEARGNRFETLFVVTLFTGVREGEILGLTWDCVDFEHNALYVNKQLQKTKKVGGEYVLAPTKSGRSRMITVAPSVIHLLKKQKRQQAQMRLLAGQDWKNPWDLVFTNEHGGNLSHFMVYKTFKEIVKSIGLGQERFHDLRHSYAVVSLESGDDIKTVQTNLGHATASFTLDVYGHISQKMRQQSADRMEQFIRKISG